MNNLPEHPYENQDDFYEECNQCGYLFAIVYHTGGGRKFCHQHHVEYLAEEAEYRYDTLTDR